MSHERRPVSMLSAGRRVFEFALPDLLWGRRGRWVALLLAWPALFAALSFATGTERAAWKDVAFGFYLDTLLPLVALIHATRLIRDEVESRTIVYLLSRPVPRAAILGGKLAAYFAAVLGVAWPSLVLGFFLSAPPLAGGGVSALLRALASAAVALAAYGALFTFLGLILRKPLVAGLLILFGWEGLVHATGLLPRVTLTAYIRVLAGAADAPGDIAVSLAALVVGAFTLIFLAAAVVAFQQGEFVPEP